MGFYVEGEIFFLIKREKVGNPGGIDDSIAFTKCTFEKIYKEFGNQIYLLVKKVAKICFIFMVYSFSIIYIYIYICMNTY